ncbi:MAG: HD domain-containing protein [Pseudomonadota bacterium]
MEFEIPPDISYYIDWFHSFSKGYLQGTAEDKRNIQMKIDHSMRVLRVSEEIIDWLDLPSPTSGICRIAALFHDVGRFDQYARFQSYNDLKTVNHAAVGVKILKKEGILAAIEPSHRRTILAAVLLHNRHHLQDNLPVQVDLALRIIRDADKIDIMSTIIEYFSNNEDRNALLFGLKSDPEEYSKNILENIHSGAPVRYEDLVWVNDFKLLVSGWLTGFSYPVSAKIAIDRGYLGKLLSFLPQDAQVQSLKPVIQRRLSAIVHP